MITVKMNKIRLIVARTDFENVLHELILLGCVEITDPDEFWDNPELSGLAVRDVVTLDKFHASQDSIVILKTQYTALLTGWVAVRSEPSLTAQLSKFICAWEFEPPQPDGHDNPPVKLRWPKLFGVFYKGGGKTFDPLRSGVSGQELADSGDRREE